jgi:LysM repeat protein
MMSQVPSPAKPKPGKKERKDRHVKKEKPVSAAPSQVVVVVDEKPLAEKHRKSHRYNLAREMYSQNGVPFIYSCSGETYSDIAKQYNLFLNEILRYNDVEYDGELPCGTVVYLQAKKSKAAKGYDEYIVEEGMGLWEISQKYGVKEKKLRKLNGFAEDYQPNAGDVIVLR